MKGLAGGLLTTLMVFAVGCGEQKQETRQDTNVTQPAPNAPTVTAEQNDAIDALFRRKAPQLQHCWVEEYQRTQNRKIEGDITLSMIITKAGQATQIKNVKSTINAPTIDECVLKEIATWVFPEGPGEAPYRRTVHLGAEF
jgi:hypothetical protein